MHGYELRKRLNLRSASFRPLSYGSLYPCLRELLDRGWITEAAGTPARRRHAGPSGARIVYELTADGKEHFQELITEAGPTAWEDDTFDVHFAFFSRTEAEVRLRILEGRRSRLEERLDSIRTARPRTASARPLHRRAAAARPGVRRARGPLAHRADHRRAAHVPDPATPPASRTQPRPPPSHRPHASRPPPPTTP